VRAAHALRTSYVLLMRREGSGTRLTAYRTARMLRCRDGRLSVIKRDEIVAVCARHRRVPCLCRRRSEAPCVARGDLSACRLRGYPAVAAVKAGSTVRERVTCDRAAIRVDVMDDGAVYVRDGRVVVKGPSIPITTDKAGAVVAVTIVDAAVEADTRSPITLYPNVARRREAPITRRPI